MLVVFTSTVEFNFSAVYMGGVPLAKHDSMPPSTASKAFGKIIVGLTDGKKEKKVKI